MMVRRILFSVCLLIILGLCIYGYRNHKRVQTLGGKIDRLEQQLKQNKTDRENLQKELDDLQKELQEIVNLERGRLKIGMSPGRLDHWAPHLLPEFMAAFSIFASPFDR